MYLPPFTHRVISVGFFREITASCGGQNIKYFERKKELLFYLREVVTLYRRFMTTYSRNIGKELLLAA